MLKVSGNDYLKLTHSTLGHELTNHPSYMHFTGNHYPMFSYCFEILTKSAICDQASEMFSISFSQRHICSKFKTHVCYCLYVYAYTSINI